MNDRDYAAMDVSHLPLRMIVLIGLAYQVEEKIYQRFLHRIKRLSQ